MLTTPPEDGAPFSKGITPPSPTRALLLQNNPKVAPFSKGMGTTLPPLKSPPGKGGRQHLLNPPLKRGKETPPQRDIRQIISGIAMHFPDPQTLVGGSVCLSRTGTSDDKGLESNGMLFVVSTTSPPKPRRRRERASLACLSRTEIPKEHALNDIS